MQGRGSLHQKITTQGVTGYGIRLLENTIPPYTQNKVIFLEVNKKLTQKKKPMGAQNMALVFAEMMVVIQADWEKDLVITDIPIKGLDVVMYIIALFVILLSTLLNHLEVFPDFLSHYHCTFKLKKTRF